MLETIGGVLEPPEERITLFQLTGLHMEPQHAWCAPQGQNLMVKKGVGPSLRDESINGHLDTLADAQGSQTMFSFWVILGLFEPV